MLGRFYKLRNKLNSIIFKEYIRFRYPHVRIGKNLKIIGKFHFLFSKDSKVFLGNNIIIKSSRRSTFIGINRPTSIVVKKNAELSIGDNTGFSGTSITVTTKIIIGKYCNFGGNTAIWDTDFHPLDSNERRIHNTDKIRNAPVVIGDDVFVGAYSLIMKGVTIGDRSIIGAGSVVSKNIPPDEIWAGNPARFIRKITTEI
jgi:acetyltransferase-like isoleucine patch superfamily enzyme